MYKQLLVTAIICCSGIVSAQIKKAEKLLKSGDLEGAIAAYENDLNKANKAPVALNALAGLYADSTQSVFNLKSAYEAIIAAQETLKTLSSKDKEKLRKQKISSFYLNNTAQKLIQQAIDATLITNTENTYNIFLKEYPTASSAQQNKIKIARNKILYTEAKKAKKYTTYERIYKEYNSDLQKLTPDVYRNIQLGMFETFIAERSWAMFYGFAEMYPDNPYIKEEDIALVYIQMQRKNDIIAFQEFAKNNSISLYAGLAEQRLFDLTMASKDLLHYDYFVRNHKSYEALSSLWQQYYSLYKTQNGPKSIFKFEKTYPSFPFKAQLESDKKKLSRTLDKPLRDKIIKSENIKDILELMRQSPKSPWWPELEPVFYAALEKKNLSTPCKFFLNNYPKSKHYSAVKSLYYNAFTADGELKSINLFLDDYPEFKQKPNVIADLEVARLGAKIRLHQNYLPVQFEQYDTYIKKAAPKARAFVALQRMLMYNLHQKNWKSALGTISDYEAYFGKDHAGIQSLKQLLSSTAPPLTKRRLNNSLNTDHDEYMPVLTMDEQTLYFCRMDAQIQDENIYYSVKQNNKWSAPKAMTAINTNSEHEAVVGVSPDHQTLLLFKEGDIYASDKNDFGWSAPKKLPATINSKDKEADACFTPDGRAIIFASASDRVTDHYIPAPKEYHGAKLGNMDLFISFKDKDGSWQTPINLGYHLNTQFCERSPFLHPDMKTLYFSSDGHGGMGKLDVYKTTRLDDSWTNWSTPVNLGKYINTPYDDWGYKITSNGKKAYFAFTSDRFESSDLYEVDLPSAYSPDQVITVSGTITDKNGKAVRAEIIWEDLDSGEEIARMHTSGNDGSFTVKIPLGKHYSYFIYHKDYYPFSNPLNLKNSKAKTLEIQEKIELIRIKDLTTNKQSLPIQNLLFKSNSSQLPTQAHAELKRIANLINYHFLTVFIVGHTDSRGNQEYNQKLAMERATAVKDFLIREGCNPRSVYVYGKGAKQPKGDNTTKKGRSQNRRVELIFEK